MITSLVVLLTMALAGTSQAAGTGTLSHASGWYNAGSPITITAIPGTYSQFDGWSGDTASTTVAVEQISFTVDGARSLTATFSSDRTTNGLVPYEWLATWTNMNWEASATNDWDRDGFTNEEEYWSGTDPMNSASFLQISGAGRQDGGMFRLSWSHANVDPRIPPIVIERRTNLLSGVWEYAGELNPTNGINAYATSLSGYCYYRLVITNAP
ncbi:MAG TPA: hypothetical protein DCS43_06255 [Verrucomicrobia bacterium]|nr:hypothetical protein [Verrucomicrobiota bacterium]